MEMKGLTGKQLEAIRHIRNWVAHRGRTPSIRELMGNMRYKSPRSVQDIIEQLAAKGIIKKFEDGRYQLIHDPRLGRTHAQTVNVPVVGTVAAGTPILAEENIEGFLPISTSLAKPGNRYFLLRVRGDSMDEAGINDGDFALVKQQPVANSGDRVVALIDNEATVKEFHLEKDVVVLKPRSKNPDNKPIILGRDFQIQGVVVAAVPKFE
ncbi:MAG: transcriptional repressor LexA [Deltaproteobacteria bacterium]|nr:transcriptional repressor LexA [Deltaproteobacteria bacterium]